MAKKKTKTIPNQQTENTDFELPRLGNDEYWEWRCTIAEMQCEKHKYLSAEATVKLLQKNVETAEAQVKLFAATALRAAREGSDAAKSEYFRFKKSLEEKLGTSLDNKVIDDLTFEVKSLPKENTTT